MEVKYLRDSEFLVLLLITTFVVITNVYFIAWDDGPQSWDPALHLTYSFVYFNLIKSLQFSEIVKVSNYYPPFFHLSSTPLYFLFGFSEDIAILTNLIYYFILIYSVFQIAKIIKDRKVGVISAVIISAFPALIKFQRVYMLDFALLSLTAFAILLYLRSEDFRNLKYSVLFGIVFGIAELTKWNAFVYIIPSIFALFLVNYFMRCPYCHQIVKNGWKVGYRRFCSKKHLKLYEKSAKTNNTMLNFAISLFVAFLFAAWWYLPNLSTVIMRLTYFANIGGKEGDPAFLTIQGWIYYANSILDAVGAVFLILFAVSIYYLYKNNRYLFLGLLTPIALIYIILTLLSNKDPRYIMPVLPFVAISVGVFVSSLANRKYSTILTFIILLFGLLNISALTFGQPDIDNKILPNPEHPKKEDWKIYALLEAIKESGGEGKIVVVLPDHPYLNGQSLNFYRLKEGYKFAIYNGVYIGYEAFVHNFDKITYIILIEPREHKGVYGDIEKKLYEFFYERKDNFEVVKVFGLPDNSKLYIYKRT